MALAVEDTNSTVAIVSPTSEEMGHPTRNFKRVDAPVPRRTPHDGCAWVMGGADVLPYGRSTLRSWQSTQ